MLQTRYFGPRCGRRGVRCKLRSHTRGSSMVACTQGEHAVQQPATRRCCSQRASRARRSAAPTAAAARRALGLPPTAQQQGWARRWYCNSSRWAASRRWPKAAVLTSCVRLTHSLMALPRALRVSAWCANRALLLPFAKVRGAISLRRHRFDIVFSATKGRPLVKEGPWRRGRGENNCCVPGLARFSARCFVPMACARPEHKREQRWRRMLAALREFIGEHKRLPRNWEQDSRGEPVGV